MASKRTISFVTLALVGMLAVAWIFVLWNVGATRLVSILGVENSYLLTFGIAALGGFSSLTGVSLMATVITLSAGGADPLWLGMSAGAGMTIGDMLYFYLGKAGRNSIPQEGRLHRLVEVSSKWLSQKPKWMTPLVTLLYAALLPLPNDILAVTLALAGGKTRHFIVPLFIGNIIHACIWALLGEAAMHFW